MRSKRDGTSGTRGIFGKFVRHNYDPAKTKIEWARSATKHRVSRERSRLVIERSELAAQQEPPSGARNSARRLAFFGDDDEGVSLEVIAVQIDETRLLVIHAMPLRNRYRPDYEEVMKWPR